MSDQRFGPLLAFTDVEFAVRDHYKLWIDTWLSARERALGITPRTIARPRSFVIKQSFTALPGEERTPMIVVVSDGFRSEPHRNGDGRYRVDFRFAVAAVCMGGGEGQARMIAGHYQAALLGIAIKHSKVNDYIFASEFNDFKIDDLDEESIGRSMAAARIELTYRVNNFVEDFDPPGTPDPPEDPTQPQPDSPTVKEGGVHINVEKL